MAFFRFWGAYAEAKGVAANKSLIQALAAADPAGMSEAQLKIYSDQLDQVTQHVAELTVVHDREAAEYQAVLRTNQQQLAAADVLQQQLEVATDPEKTAGLEKSLTTLLTQIEANQADLQREKTEAEEAKADLDQMKEVQLAAADKLKRAKAATTAAQREITRAEAERDRAEQRAAMARETVGLSSGSDIDVALNAMKDAAAKAHAEAEAISLKASALAPEHTEDANIAAAMAEVSGAVPDHTQSVAERLAALKAKAA